MSSNVWKPHLRPVQVRLGPAQLHHFESQLDILRLWQILHFGLIQTRVENHRGVVHHLLIINTEQLPVHTQIWFK